MSWLTEPDDAATTELARLTEPWRRRGEQVPPVMRVLKTNPRAFEAVLELNYALAFGASSLGRRREELVATWVSALNDCFFCLATHARYLESVWGGAKEEYLALVRQLPQLARRFRGGEVCSPEALSALPGLESGDAALLKFVTDVTLAPHERQRTGCEALRAAGFSEREVLDAVLVAACFAFMNRLASGTGVALDASKHAAAADLFGRVALDRHVAWAAHTPTSE